MCNNRISTEYPKEGQQKIWTVAEFGLHFCDGDVGWKIIGSTDPMEFAAEVGPAVEVPDIARGKS